MNEPEELRSWAERIRKSTRIADVISFCDAVVEFLVSGDAKKAAQKKRERTDYMKRYMQRYRKKKKLGDFAD